MERLIIVLALCVGCAGSEDGSAGDSTTTTTTNGVDNSSTDGSGGVWVGDCCRAHPGGGCTVDSIEACVCVDVPGCCDIGWDDGCVDYAAQAGCAYCADEAAKCHAAEEACYSGSECQTCEYECEQLGGLWSSYAVAGCQCADGDDPCVCAHAACLEASKFVDEGPITGVCAGCSSLCDDDKMTSECEEHL